MFPFALKSATTRSSSIPLFQSASLPVLAQSTPSSATDVIHAADVKHNHSSDSHNTVGPVLNGASGVSVSSAQQVSSVAAEAASPSLQVSSGVAEVATYFSNQYNSGEGVLTPPAVHTSSTEASAGEPTMAGLSDFNRPVGSTSSSTHFEHLGDSGVDLQLDHIVDER
ncbi:hypothetical protein V6N11_036663 [Hibiscus sabdariffa]|uniref:Uncharacterized protein n=1 Tax=Hibiscus sabdariffa TaxID=183260 RepID=A0ABR2RBL8_9ROSI